MLVVFVSLMLKSCFGTACRGPNDHYHTFHETDKGKDSIQVYIRCRPGRKTVFINNIKKEDVVYISSNLSDNEGEHLGKMHRTLENKRYHSLKIKNADFHQRLENGSIKVRIEKGQASETHIFYSKKSMQ